jgi:hypothetical protein
MDTLITGLNKRYDIVIQSTSDKEFYLNIHQYFDYIYKNEVLKAFIDNSQKTYAKAMYEIWGDYRPYTQEELDTNSAKVCKLEHFNLYAMQAGIYVRVYLPIEDYKTTTDTDDKQDPVVVILMRGFDYALNLNVWSKGELKEYKKWFEGRGRYEPELRRIHLILLDELNKPNLATEDIPKKPELSFDYDDSILKIGDKQVRIKMKNDYPNAHYVLEYIFDNEDGIGSKSYYSEMIDTKFPKEKMEWRSVYRACLDINKKVSEQAKISEFLIIKTGISGYVQVNSEFL